MYVLISKMWNLGDLTKPPAGVYVGMVRSRSRLSKAGEEARRHSPDGKGEPAVRLFPGSGAGQAGASGVRRL
jgi:hypothetical protein